METMDCKSMCAENRDTLQNVLTEAELLKLTGLKKSQLADCRNKKHLPFLKINQYCRLYLERDVVDWLKRSRTVLGSGA
jgi:hypothetical protein